MRSQGKAPVRVFQTHACPLGYGCTLRNANAHSGKTIAWQWDSCVEGDQHVWTIVTSAVCSMWTMWTCVVLERIWNKSAPSRRRLSRVAKDEIDRELRLSKSVQHHIVHISIYIYYIYIYISCGSKKKVPIKHHKTLLVKRRNEQKLQSPGGFFLS